MPEKYRRLPLRRRLTVIMLCLLIILTLAFIFGNSLEDRQTSEAASEQFERIVEPLLRALPYERLHTKDALSNITRKLAHFGEFFMLGTQLMALSLLVLPVILVRKRIILLASLLTAAADELLQFISRRAPQVQDALLDTFGALCGILFVYGIYRLYSRVFGQASKGGIHA